jgi:hypothetical protein
MGPQEIAEAVKEATTAAIKEYHKSMQDEEKPFWIDRENHFRHHDSLTSIGIEKHEEHHDFTGGWLEFWKWVRETVVKTVVRIVVGGTLVLLTAGLVAWLKYNDEISKMFGG